jgi:hypothetical protein
MYHLGKLEMEMWPQLSPQRTNSSSLNSPHKRISPPICLVIWVQTIFRLYTTNQRSVCDQAKKNWKWIKDLNILCDNYFISRILQVRTINLVCKNIKILRHTRHSKIYLPHTCPQEVIERCILQTHEDK